eukprot:scaffold7017_cov134-Cylindrotheca_fusiformis.AAC.33
MIIVPELILPVQQLVFTLLDWAYVTIRFEFGEFSTSVDTQATGLAAHTAQVVVVDQILHHLGEDFVFRKGTRQLVVFETEGYQVATSGIDGRIGNRTRQLVAVQIQMAKSDVLIAQLFGNGTGEFVLSKVIVEHSSKAHIVWNGTSQLIVVHIEDTCTGRKEGAYRKTANGERNLEGRMPRQRSNK